MTDIKSWRSRPELAADLHNILAHPTMQIALAVLYHESRYATSKIDHPQADILTINAMLNKYREGMTFILDTFSGMAITPVQRPESSHPPGFAETALRDENAVPPAPVQKTRKKK